VVADYWDFHIFRTGGFLFVSEGHWHAENGTVRRWSRVVQSRVAKNCLPAIV
jgi:hypothetical protein